MECANCIFMNMSIDFKMQPTEEDIFTFLQRSEDTHLTRNNNYITTNLYELLLCDPIIKIFRSVPIHNK